MKVFITQDDRGENMAVWGMREHAERYCAEQKERIPALGIVEVDAMSYDVNPIVALQTADERDRAERAKHPDELAAAKAKEPW